MTLLAIGEFSRMSRLSLKALRLYDENGLLKPASVDPKSGYRYYEPSQANRAEAIRILRSIDMPLDEIAAVLEADDVELANKQLLVHRERLAERLAADQRMLVYLEALINRRVGIMPYTVELHEIASVQVACTRLHTSLSKVGDDIGRGFALLVPALTAHDITPSGAPLIVYHDVIDEETAGDIEICVPIVGDIADGPVVRSRELEGGMMATTIHRGPYPEVAPAYHTLTGWIADNDYEIVGPPRETYLNDPQIVEPSELLTKVEFPVCKLGS